MPLIPPEQLPKSLRRVLAVRNLRPAWARGVLVSRSTDYSPDTLCRHIEARSQIFAGGTGNPQKKQLLYLLICELGVSIAIAVVMVARLHAMPKIFFSGHPFEILKTWIAAVAVFMVHIHTGDRHRRKEGGSDQAVDLFNGLLPVSGKVHHGISVRERLLEDYRPNLSVIGLETSNITLVRDLVVGKSSHLFPCLHKTNYTKWSDICH